MKYIKDLEVEDEWLEYGQHLTHLILFKLGSRTAIQCIGSTLGMAEYLE